MSFVTRLADKADNLQQSRPWLAVPVATWKKFSDNQAGNLAALIAYYAFASLFPLLLVAYSILDLISRNNAKLASRLTTALHQYPVIGGQLGGDASQGLSKTGFALVIGILLTLYAGRGVATAMQNAMNTVWGVPLFRRPQIPQEPAAQPRPDRPARARRDRDDRAVQPSPAAPVTSAARSTRSPRSRSPWC